MNKNRCGWCGKDPLYQKYHDKEWGTPTFDEQILFEMLILETLQAGLSWITVLKKREAYRTALDNFNAKKIAKYDEQKYEALMIHPELIKNKLKMRAIIHNAKQYLALCKTDRGLAHWLWAYIDGKPINNHFEKLSDVPAQTPLSDQISRDLKKFGFKFVGSVTIYAYMQAIGMVNDHIKDCFKYQE